MNWNKHRKWDGAMTRELLGSERENRENKWGQEIAQCVPGILNDPALQCENQLVGRNKHVCAYSVWWIILKVYYFFVHSANMYWVPAMRQELY